MNLNQWDESKLSTFLSPSDADHVRRMYLPQHSQPDIRLWHYSKTGLYTVKSGYWLGMNLLHPDPLLIPPKGDPQLKSRIWRTTITPKLKHFYWRVLSLAIGTGAALTRRGIPIDDKCHRCGDIVETINHLLFECPFAQQVWRLSPLSHTRLHQPSAFLEDNVRLLLEIYDTLTDQASRLSCFWIGWHIWKARNVLIFSKLLYSPEDVLRKVHDDVAEFVSAGSSSQFSSGIGRLCPNTQQSLSWQKPPPGYVKVNYDGSFQYHSGSIGVGWIIRDDGGNYLCSGSQRVQQATNPLEAEGLALLHAIQAAWSQGFHSVVCEGDCKPLHELVHNKLQNTSMQGLLVDIRSCADRFTQIRFVDVPRDCNGVADRLAKLAHHQHTVSQFYSFSPTCIRTTLISDPQVD